MPFLWKPGHTAITSFLDEQAKLDVTYEAVGATADRPPERYVVDRTREVVGHGVADFATARQALIKWRQFEVGWLEVWPTDAALDVGTVLAIVARSTGLWWLNACRIVYVVDEEDRFGCAYGTLPSHAASGEERFLVERDAEGDVWYDVLAFSRPRHLLARLGYPLARRVQRRFGRDSTEAMRRAVSRERTK